MKSIIHSNSLLEPFQWREMQLVALCLRVLLFPIQSAHWCHRSSVGWLTDCLLGCWYYLNDSHYKKKKERIRPTVMSTTNDCAHSVNCISFIAHYHFNRMQFSLLLFLGSDVMRLRHEEKTSLNTELLTAQILWTEHWFGFASHTHTQNPTKY